VAYETAALGVIDARKLPRFVHILGRFVRFRGDFDQFEAFFGPHFEQIRKVLSFLEKHCIS